MSTRRIFTPYLIIFSLFVGVPLLDPFGLPSVRADVLEDLMDSFQSPQRRPEDGLSPSEARVMRDRIQELVKERNIEEAIDLWLQHCGTTESLRPLRDTILEALRRNRRVAPDLGLKVLEACGGPGDMPLPRMYALRFCFLDRAERFDEARETIVDFAKALNDLGPDSDQRPRYIYEHRKVLDHFLWGKNSDYMEAIAWSLFMEERTSSELFLIFVLPRIVDDNLIRNTRQLHEVHDNFISLPLTPADRIDAGNTIIGNLLRPRGYSRFQLTDEDRIHEAEHILDHMPEEIAEWTHLMRFRVEVFAKDVEGIMSKLPEFRLVNSRIRGRGLAVEHNPHLRRAALVLVEAGEWDSLLQIATPLAELETKTSSGQRNRSRYYNEWKIFKAVALLRLGNTDEALEILEKIGSIGMNHPVVHKVLLESEAFTAHLLQSLREEDSVWTGIFHQLFVNAFHSDIAPDLHDELNRIYLETKSDPETFIFDTILIFRRNETRMAPKRVLAFYLLAEAHFQMTPLPWHDNYFQYLVGLRHTNQRENWGDTLAFYEKFHAEIIRTQAVFPPDAIYSLSFSNYFPERKKLAKEILEQLIEFQPKLDTRRSILTQRFRIYPEHQHIPKEESDRLYREFFLPVFLSGDLADPLDLRIFFTQEFMRLIGVRDHYLHLLAEEPLEKFPRITLETLSALAQEFNLPEVSEVFLNAANRLQSDAPEGDAAPITGRDWRSPVTDMEFVWIDEMDLWVGKYEVTNAEYRLKEPGHRTSHVSSFRLNRDRQPVVMINFQDAAAYARWLTEQEQASGALPEGMRYRLPTERESLTYAEAGKDWKYPWGNNWPPESGQAGNYRDLRYERFLGAQSRHANIRLFIPDYDDGHTVTAPVDETWPNPWGIHGVGENVSEISARDVHNRQLGSARGANWRSGREESLRISYRFDINPEIRTYLDVGFRVLLSP